MSEAPKDTLSEIGQKVREAFTRNKRVMSFAEFHKLFTTKPEQFCRGAAQYLKDAIDHFGTYDVQTPRGKLRRYRVFDVPFDNGRDRLVGQEEVQGRVYRIIANFVRQGQVNKLVLLHGPNGSAKSTFVSCLERALEHYSSIDEGALYRFNWIFPSQKLQKSGIGFGGYDGEVAAKDSFAYLDDDMIDAKLVDELKDNPLLLVPPEERLTGLASVAAGERPRNFVMCDYIRHGDLNPKNKQIFEALLIAYKGDYQKVLRHVQVERFFVSRRYRTAAVTVEPQMAVDARSRQITMDRSLSALPPALLSLSLSEYGGELVEANRGIIGYADLLKRPLEAYKYLLGTVEHAEVGVDASILFLDTFFIASSNESHLAVFKEVPEFQSFKGRLELVRMPYLTDYKVEQQIYEDELQQPVGKHIAPHVAWTAALWAVLTRMRKPLPEKYGKTLAETVARLSPLDKAELYATGKTPEALAQESAKELRANIDRLYAESDTYPNYEGRTGASPREMKTLLLNAAQNDRFACVSPLGVFEELEELCKNVSVYEFLKQEPLPGGFHENKKFISTVRDRYLDVVDDEVRSSMGLVEESQHKELLHRYVTHVSHAIKKEKLRNPTTGRLDDPDTDMMAEVEKTIGVTTNHENHRHELISRVGAWSLENPGKKPDYAEVFPAQLAALRDAYFERSKKLIRKTTEDLLAYLTDGKEALRLRLDRDSFDRVERTMANLKSRYGYCDECMRDVIGFLMRRRYVAN